MPISPVEREPDGVHPKLILFDFRDLHLPACAASFPFRFRSRVFGSPRTPRRGSTRVKIVAPTASRNAVQREFPRYRTGDHTALEPSRYGARRLRQPSW